MNVPLLRRIQRQIDKAPERFMMRGYSAKTECGTSCCIAGWACALSGSPLNSLESGHAPGMEKLDLTDEEAGRLFFIAEWPKQFYAHDYDPVLPSLAIQRIDHFIATEGRE